MKKLINKWIQTILKEKISKNQLQFSIQICQLLQSINPKIQFPLFFNSRIINYTNFVSFLNKLDIQFKTKANIQQLLKNQEIIYSFLKEIYDHYSQKNILKKTNFINAYLCKNDGKYIQEGIFIISDQNSNLHFFSTQKFQKFISSEKIINKIQIKIQKYKNTNQIPIIIFLELKKGITFFSSNQFFRKFTEKNISFILKEKNIISQKIHHLIFTINLAIKKRMRTLIILCLKMFFQYFDEEGKQIQQGIIEIDNETMKLIDSSGNEIISENINDTKIIFNAHQEILFMKCKNMFTIIIQKTLFNIFSRTISEKSKNFQEIETELEKEKEIKHQQKDQKLLKNFMFTEGNQFVKMNRGLISNKIINLIQKAFSTENFQMEAKLVQIDYLETNCSIVLGSTHISMIMYSQGHTEKKYSWHFGVNIFVDDSKFIVKLVVSNRAFYIRFPDYKKMIVFVYVVLLKNKYHGLHPENWRISGEILDQNQEIECVALTCKNKGNVSFLISISSDDFANESALLEMDSEQVSFFFKKHQKQQVYFWKEILFEIMIDQDSHVLLLNIESEILFINAFSLIKTLLVMRCFNLFSVMHKEEAPKLKTTQFFTEDELKFEGLLNYEYFEYKPDPILEEINLNENENTNENENENENTINIEKYFNMQRNEKIITIIDPDYVIYKSELQDKIFKINDNKKEEQNLLEFRKESLYKYHLKETLDYGQDLHIEKLCFEVLLMNEFQECVDSLKIFLLEKYCMIKRKNQQVAYQYNQYMKILVLEENFGDSIFFLNEIYHIKIKFYSLKQKKLFEDGLSNRISSKMPYKQKKNEPVFTCFIRTFIIPVQVFLTLGSHWIEIELSFKKFYIYYFSIESTKTLENKISLILHKNLFRIVLEFESEESARQCYHEIKRKKSQFLGYALDEKMGILNLKRINPKGKCKLIASSKILTIYQKGKSFFANFYKDIKILQTKKSLVVDIYFSEEQKIRIKFNTIKEKEQVEKILDQNKKNATIVNINSVRNSREIKEKERLWISQLAEKGTNPGIDFNFSETENEFHGVVVDSELQKQFGKATIVLKKDQIFIASNQILIHSKLGRRETKVYLEITTGQVVKFHLQNHSSINILFKNSKIAHFFLNTIRKYMNFQEESEDTQKEIILGRTEQREFLDFGFEYKINASLLDFNLRYSGIAKMTLSKHILNIKINNEKNFANLIEKTKISINKINPLIWQIVIDEDYLFLIELIDIPSAKKFLEYYKLAKSTKTNENSKDDSRRSTLTFLVQARKESSNLWEKVIIVMSFRSMRINFEKEHFSQRWFDHIGLIKNKDGIFQIKFDKQKDFINLKFSSQEESQLFYSSFQQATRNKFLKLQEFPQNLDEIEEENNDEDYKQKLIQNLQENGFLFEIEMLNNNLRKTGIDGVLLMESESFSILTNVRSGDDYCNIQTYKYHHNFGIQTESGKNSSIIRIIESESQKKIFKIKKFEEKQIFIDLISRILQKK
ncbi:hypothetical protein M0811_01764 [Anaeramoeba ignava]|uniref:Uncharacterized protein n=1 Tax=Anaeramoeba ignava TaxID=1746090 RepID=A0A9Q0R8V0_ANAIG|nr:hypothetical protein M0811_01764 [Anaeramoeba ignava]